jgi:Ca2+-binding EF-hand superfamily protein
MSNNILSNNYDELFKSIDINNDGFITFSDLNNITNGFFDKMHLKMLLFYLYVNTDKIKEHKIDKNSFINKIINNN